MQVVNVCASIRSSRPAEAPTDVQMWVKGHVLGFVGVRLITLKVMS